MAERNRRGIKAEMEESREILEAYVEVKILLGFSWGTRPRQWNLNVCKGFWRDSHNQRFFCYRRTRPWWRCWRAAGPWSRACSSTPRMPPRPTRRSCRQGYDGELPDDYCTPASACNAV